MASEYTQEKGETWLPESPLRGEPPINPGYSFRLQVGRGGGGGDKPLLYSVSEFGGTDLLEILVFANRI